MGKLIIILPATMLAGMLCFAQPPAAPPKPAGTAAPAIDPSRYVGDNFDEYVQSLTASFDVARRTRDPFGAPQDPDAKPAVTRPRQSAAPVEPQIPFGSIISQIQINTVMAGEKRFLVGSRSIAQGDEFPLNYQGQRIRILVTEVSARKVEFKNLETGEVAAHQLNMLPPGMRPAQGGMAPPGMVPAGADAPLEIQPDAAQPGYSPNR